MPRITKEQEGLLSMRPCPLKLTLLAEEHGKLIECPGLLVRFMLLAVQCQAACEAANGRLILTLLAQDRAKTALDLPFTCFISQVQRIPLGTAQDRAQL